MHPMVYKIVCMGSSQDNVGTTGLSFDSWLELVWELQKYMETLAEFFVCSKLHETAIELSGNN